MEGFSKSGTAAELQRDLEELFNSQNKSKSETISNPATFLMVTVNRHS
jgi:hypothetical protein